jgi:uncharacterized protein (TIGR03067 family)
LGAQIASRRVLLQTFGGKNMKLKNLWLSFAAALAFSPLAIAGDYPLTNGDNGLEEMQGTWQLVEGVKDGTTMSQEEVEKMQLTIDGNTFSMAGASEADSGTFTIDTSVTPHTIDITHSEGPHAGETCLGIYKVEGDKQTAAFTRPGEERPTEFASTPGSGVMLQVWERIQ